ncbi:F-box/kelch-repeat protein At3g06240-like [Rosa rugosa]|uniref:F-box/kelch-repeat protein At3g06240-like n=1 Tax=Rosa rugosa TaxID=74645 RepID=UPI002B412EC0|nr:F-box/kelch-repeat protein At3g06240-like [Rosa rugosa]
MSVTLCSRLVLSDEIIVEILARLPVKSLIRFRCVSKAWRAFISDPYFVRKHLSHSDTKNSFNLNLLLSTYLATSIHYRALLKIEEDGTVASSELQYPIQVPNAFTSRILEKRLVGSYNGLICLSFYGDTADTFMLWNPCTGESKLLPKPTAFDTSYGVFYGFGYDSAADDCKIVRGNCRSRNGGGIGDGPQETIIEVFALKTGCWRTLETVDNVVLSDQGCFVNGALHWFNEQRFPVALMCFDLAEERFREVAVPYPPGFVEEHYFSVGIAVIRNCLTVYFEPTNGSDYKMWVMKEYGIKESWAEVMSIPFEVLPGDYVLGLEPLCLFENDEVLMSLDREALTLYNQKEKTFRNIFKCREDHFWSETATYVESLVSPFTMFV